MKRHVSLGSSDAQLAIQVIGSEPAKRGKAAVIAVSGLSSDELAELAAIGATAVLGVIGASGWTALSR